MSSSSNNTGNSGGDGGKFYRKIPSFVWILIIVGGVALFIGAMLAGFYALAFVEGVASVILLVCGWAAFRVGNNSPNLESSSFGVAVIITFFALMGASLDQTGNYFYNQPMEWIFCPAESKLVREVVTRAIRGGVALSQISTCVADSGGAVLRNISGFEQFAFRFFEYVLIGYVLLGASRLYTRIKSSVKANRRKGARV
ncbi:MAG: hypothetical protein M3384_21005 [Acidobacteriota bacterium]|nr:hypothetical protein [Acidobacteriota bacterium]